MTKDCLSTMRAYTLLQARTCSKTEAWKDCKDPARDAMFATIEVIATTGLYD